MPRLRVPGGPTLQRYLEDARLQLDNGPAKQAIRPLAVGRRNRLHIAGDGGLKSAAMLLSPAASAKRHPKDSWPYVTHALEAAAGRPKDADFSNLLPDAWASAQPPPSPA